MLYKNTQILIKTKNHIEKLILKNQPKKIFNKNLNLYLYLLFVSEKSRGDKSFLKLDLFRKLLGFLK